MKKKVGFVIAGICLCWYFINSFDILPHKKYTDEDFNIVTYKSTIDKDKDGMDDCKLSNRIENIYSEKLS